MWYAYLAIFHLPLLDGSLHLFCFLWRCPCVHVFVLQAQDCKDEKKKKKEQRFLIRYADSDSFIARFENSYYRGALYIM